MVGRPRTIDRESVLDAAQAVAARDGAAYLTLEAVATEAGISKASVLYDYKNKQALMRAVIERRIAAEDARIQEIQDRLGDEPNAAILGCTHYPLVEAAFQQAAFLAAQDTFQQYRAIALVGLDLCFAEFDLVAHEWLPPGV